MKDKRRKRRLSHSALIAIIISAVAAAIVIALIIVNAFIPVRYLSAYAVRADKNTQGQLRVTFIDVGFGDSTLIELPDGKTALIDGGDGSYPNQLKLLKTLNEHGIEYIDYLICSSVKKEHCGGLSELIKLKGVGTAFIPYCLNERITDEYHAFITALKDKNIASNIAQVGEGFDGEDYFFTFLSPSNYLNPTSEYTQLNTNPDKENTDNASAVCWLECFGKKFAFCSDVRSEALERAMADYNLHKSLGDDYCPFNGKGVEPEGCDVITVAAHGGEKNACAAWYSLLKPEHAVVSVGLNYSGYPSAIALSNPTGVGAELYLTSEVGNVEFIVNSQGLRVA
ncbi:MAG: ComEC/Rec2 family competence protein [Candidatus Coproplasma sp.]